MKTRSFVLKFNPQKAENRILGLWNVKISHSRTRLDPVFPPKRRGLTAPCWYSWLLDSNLLATSIFIETPGYVFELKQQYSLLCYLLSSETWGQLTWIALTDKSSHQCPLFLVLALPSPSVWRFLSPHGSIHFGDVSEETKTECACVCCFLKFKDILQCFKQQEIWSF